MVCSLTYSKKKYVSVEEELKDVQQKLESYRQDLLTLAEKDNEAFNHVMDAFKLPKETEVQKAERIKKIDEATYEAAKVPSDVIEICSKVLPLLLIITEKGNHNSLSDSGVAISLINTAAQGAFYNVLINRSALNMEHEHISELLTNAEELAKSIQAACNEISINLLNKLGKK